VIQNETVFQVMLISVQLVISAPRNCMWQQ